MPLPPRSTRPSPDRVALGVLRPALAPYGVTVAALRSDDYLSRLPFVECRSVDGDAGRSVSLKTTAELDVQCWAGTRDEADDLDDLVLTTLRAAMRAGTTAAGGRIAALAVVRLGSELRTADQPGRLYRWQASYTATIRPV